MDSLHKITPALRAEFERLVLEDERFPALAITPSRLPHTTYMDSETESCWISFKAGAYAVLSQRDELLAAAIKVVEAIYIFNMIDYLEPIHEALDAMEAAIAKATGG